jgi:hypothetical protein
MIGRTDLLAARFFLLYREPADENERSTDVLLSAACLRSGFPDLTQNSDFTAAAGFSAG